MVSCFGVASQDVIPGSAGTGHPQLAEGSFCLYYFVNDALSLSKIHGEKMEGKDKKVFRVSI